MASLVLAYLPDGATDLAQATKHCSMALPDPLPPAFTWKQDPAKLREMWEATSAGNEAVAKPLLDAMAEAQESRKYYATNVGIMLENLSMAVAEDWS